MKGYVLGVHNGFESGVCLIYNGEILEAVSEERFNFIKVYAGTVSYTHLTLPTMIEV